MRYIRIAETMIGGNVTEALARRLDRVSALVKNAGGEATSRQIVALVIEAWERDGRP